MKIPLYQKLGKITPPHAILGSNTSSLAINDFAKPSGRPEKVVRAPSLPPPMDRGASECLSGVA